MLANDVYHTVGRHCPPTTKAIKKQLVVSIDLYSTNSLMMLVWGENVMSLRQVHLRKLLKLLYLSPRQLTAALRADIREEIKKENGSHGSGGDFHTPFWTDAKAYVAGLAKSGGYAHVDLRALTKSRIESNEGRERLYKLLTSEFLKWWNEKRRWRNERFSIIPENVHGHLSLSEVSGVIKVENTLAVRIDGRLDRIVYPYFSEKPNLSAEGARLALWVLTQAIPSHKSDEFRILDVLRSTSFRLVDDPLRGDERRLLMQRYAAILDEWEELRREYK